jgi:hypothetical protein
MLWDFWAIFSVVFPCHLLVLGLCRAPSAGSFTLLSFDVLAHDGGPVI